MKNTKTRIGLLAATVALLSAAGVGSALAATTTAASASSCHPLTSGGNCYEPGEFCPTSDHGVSGVAGDGKTITCKNNNGWRWEPTSAPVPTPTPTTKPKSTTRAPHGVCAEHGKPGSVLGNWLVYDWNNKPCPAGFYPAPLSGAVSLPVLPKPVTTDLKGAASVVTGGGFFANATEVGTVHLAAGTYQVSLYAKATPPSGGTGSVSVFPQFFVYNQAKNANFAGDLFNVGSGALESGSNANIDSYFSGSGVITVPAGGETLHVLAFGYDSDRGASSYTLDDLTVTTIPLP